MRDRKFARLLGGLLFPGGGVIPSNADTGLFELWANPPGISVHMSFVCHFPVFVLCLPFVCRFVCSFYVIIFFAFFVCHLFVICLLFVC